MLLLCSLLGLVDQSHIPVFKYFRCSLFSTITEPRVMMLSMVLPHRLQDVIRQFAHKASKRIVDYALNCEANTGTSVALWGCG